MSLPDNPITRAEQYLSRIAGEETELPPYPITRMEQYLAEIAENGGKAEPATQSEIESRTGDGVITPQNLDYAVGAFLRNGSAVMTAQEKAHAQNILGTKEITFTMADSTTVTLNVVCNEISQN